MPTIDEVRKNIILKDGIYYFDYTASGLAYAPIEDEISKFLKTYANTHSDSSSSAVLTQKRYENARAELKELLGLDESFQRVAIMVPFGYRLNPQPKKLRREISDIVTWIY